jgi:hypothetical protein
MRYCTCYSLLEIEHVCALLSLLERKRKNEICEEVEGCRAYEAIDELVGRGGLLTLSVELQTTNSITLQSPAWLE